MEYASYLGRIDDIAEDALNRLESEFEANFLEGIELYGPEEPHSSKLILSKGKVPQVSFEPEEVYNVLGERYVFTRLPRNWYRYRPTYRKLLDEKGLGWLRRFQRPNLTEQERNAFFQEIQAIQPTEEEYDEYLRLCCRKITYFGNSPEKLLETLLFLNLEGSLNYEYHDESALLDIIQEAELSEYSPQSKVVVFNPDLFHTLTPIARLKIEKRELKRHHQTLIAKALRGCYTASEIASQIGVSRTTIHTVLKRFGTKARGKGQKTADLVREWREANPKGTQKDCSEFLGKSLRTVKVYWNQKVQKV